MEHCHFFKFKHHIFNLKIWKERNQVPNLRSCSPNGMAAGNCTYRVECTARVEFQRFDSTLWQDFISFISRDFILTSRSFCEGGKAGWHFDALFFIFYCTNDDVLANLKVFRIRKPGWKEYEDKQGSIKITVRWECTHISFLKACPIFFCWTAQKEKSSEIKQKI